MRKFGLIGFPLTHSFSKKYFSDIFQQEGIDATYENYPLSSIEQLTNVLADPHLEGINVTIPYKEAVLPFLDRCSPTVEQVGACNCIHIKDGKRIGHNTDVIGFERSLEKALLPKHDKALVLGTGGAAKAVWFVLNKKGIPFLRIGRAACPGVIAYEELNPEMIFEHRLIINTTPLGMYPDVDHAPLLDYSRITPDHYLYDLVYNPSRTLFLKKGEERGSIVANGHDMLIIQADESRRIWDI